MLVIFLIQIQICSYCHGQGFVNEFHECGECEGAVVLSEEVNVNCDQCHGTGMVEITCSICGGSGEVEVEN